MAQQINSPTKTIIHLRSKSTNLQFHNQANNCKEQIKQDEPDCQDNKKNNTNLYMGKDLLHYLLDYQQLTRDGLLKFQTQKHSEDLCLIKVLELVLEYFQNGHNSQLLLLDEVMSGFDLLHAFNQILLKTKNLNKKKDDQPKITLINIISSDQKDFIIDEQFSNNFQSFTLVFNCKDQKKNPQEFFNVECYFQQQNYRFLKQNNQYICPIQKSDTISNPLDFLFRFFLKQKIRTFNPSFVVFAIEIHNQLNIGSYFLEKFIQQLDLVCQNQLLLIPYKLDLLKNLVESDIVFMDIEKVMKTSISLINALANKLTKYKLKKLKFQNFPTKEDYEQYINLFAYTTKEEKFYINQLLALNCLNKENQQEESNLDQINQSNHPFQSQQNIVNKQNKKDFDEQKNELYNTNQIALLDHNKQIKIYNLHFEGNSFVITSKTKYYVSYQANEQNSEFNTLLIVIDELKLLYANISSREVEQKIGLKIYEQFENLEVASFKLEKQIFYQVYLGFNNNEAIGKLIKYQFKIDGQIQKDTYFITQRKEDILKKITNQQQEDKLKNTIPIENFTIVYHNDGNISLIGGVENGKMFYHQGYFLKKDQDQFFFCQRYYKQESFGKYFVVRLRAYDNAMILKTRAGDVEDQFLYFESINKYSAQSAEPKLLKITFSLMGIPPKFTIEQVNQIENLQSLMQNFYLLRSDRYNINLIQSSKNQLTYEIILQEVVYQSLQLKEQSDIKNITTLNKQKMLKVHHYTLKIQNQKLESISYASKVKVLENEKIQKKNSAFQKCLFQNWLEDVYNNKIFHFDNQQSLYLLSFKKYNINENRKFTFISENQIDENDFEEIILNDLQNEIIWIVRKIYKESDYADLVLYTCEWINLIDIQTIEVYQTGQVRINEIYRLKKQTEEFHLIGLSVQEVDNNLIIYTTKQLISLPITFIKQKIWLNVMNYLPNTWIKKKIVFEQPIHTIQEIHLKQQLPIPSTVIQDKLHNVYIFYTYCHIEYDTNIKEISTLSINYFIYNSQNFQMEQKLLQKSIQSNKAIILAKITSIYTEEDKGYTIGQINQEQIYIGIILQYEDNDFERKIIYLSEMDIESQQNYEKIEDNNQNYIHLDSVASAKSQQETILYSIKQSKILLP